MTTFVLVRHAAHDLLGHAIAGRTRDVGLNAQGHGQAQALIQRLDRHAIERVYASPRVRTRETIAPFIAHAGVAQEMDGGVDEIDFGEWSGKPFSELDRDPQWRVWCERRSQAQPPGGETIRAVQSRVIATMQRLRVAHAKATVAIVSHGDVIKAALAHYLAVHLDHLERFDIAPASISVVVDDGAWAQVRLVNGTPEP